MFPKWKKVFFFVKFLKNQNIKNYTLAKSNKKLSLKKYVVSFYLHFNRNAENINQFSFLENFSKLRIFLKIVFVDRILQELLCSHLKKFFYNI